MANWIFQSTSITRTVFRFPSEFELPRYFHWTYSRKKKQKTRILSIICTGLYENCKTLFPARRTGILIVKISSHKTQKIANPQKINSRKNFVPHGRSKLVAFSELIERKTRRRVSWRIYMHKRFREIAHKDPGKISLNNVFECDFYYKLLHLRSALITFESFITFLIKYSAALGLNYICHQLY